MLLCMRLLLVLALWLCIPVHTIMAVNIAPNGISRDVKGPVMNPVIVRNDRDPETRGIHIASAAGVGSAPQLVSLVTCEGVSDQGVEPVNATDRFNPLTPQIAVLATVKDGRAGTRVKCVLVSVDAVGYAELELVTSEMAIQEEGQTILNFRFPRPAREEWPKGHYRVDLYIDGKHAKSSPLVVALPGQ